MCLSGRPEQYISPLQAIHYGLVIFGFNQRQLRQSQEALQEAFINIYGSHPIAVAEIWKQLAKVDPRRDMRRYFMCLYWLRHYPSGKLINSTFGNMCDDYTREYCWYYTKCIQLLSPLVIGLTIEDMGDDLYFFATVDGVHFTIYEPPHPTKPFDKRYCSYKDKRAGYAYQIVLSTKDNRLLAIHGPFEAGTNDGVIYDKTLAGKLPPGKVMIGDKAYRNKQGCSAPNAHFDSKQLNQFKRRARARHETFNGRLKNFKIMKECFRSTQDKRFKHRCAFEACCVIVSFQIKTTNPLMQT